MSILRLGTHELWSGPGVPQLDTPGLRAGTERYAVSGFSRTVCVSRGNLSMLGYQEYQGKDKQRKGSDNKKHYGDREIKGNNRPDT